MQFKSAELKQTGDQFTFSAKLVGYDNIDRDRDVIKSGAFKDSIKNKSKYPLLYNHNNTDLSDTIGYFEATDKSDGVYISATINDKEEKAIKVYDLIKKGVLTEMSVGFVPTDFEFDDDRGGFDISKALLFEGSVVQIPSNETAKITQVKNMKNEVKNMDLEKQVKSIQETLTALQSKVEELSSEDKASIEDAVQSNADEFAKFQSEMADILDEAKELLLETIDAGTSDGTSNEDSSNTDSSDESGN